MIKRFIHKLKLRNKRLTPKGKGLIEYCRRQLENEDEPKIATYEEIIEYIDSLIDREKLQRKLGRLGSMVKVDQLLSEEKIRFMTLAAIVNDFGECKMEDE